jgi:hypothetical protein
MVVAGNWSGSAIKPQVTGPSSSMGGLATASDRTSIVQLIRTAFDCVENCLVYRCCVAVRSRRSGLEGVAFVGAVIGVGAVG